MSEPVYRLQAFGGLSAWRAGPETPVLVGQRKRLALLAALAADGNGGTSRDRLLSWFWPEADTTRARNALKQLLHTIRRELGADVIVDSNGTLSLEPTLIESDVQSFRSALRGGALSRAVEIYRGPFLDSVYLNDAPEFGRWADDCRQRFANEYLGALTRLVESALETGEAPAALRWARTLALSDPLSTRSALLCMRALDAAGDAGAAIQQGELHARLLREELDAPAPVELERALRDLRQPKSLSRAAPTPSDTPRANDVEARPASGESPGQNDPRRPAELSDISPAHGVSADSPAPVVRPAMRRWRPWIAAASVLIFGTVTSRLLWPSEPSSSVIAIAPMGYPKGDSALAATAAIVTDHLVERIKATGDLTLVDLRGDSSTHSDARSAARRARVRRLLTGRLIRVKDSVFATMEVVNPATGRTERETDRIGVDGTRSPSLVEPFIERASGLVSTITDSVFGPWAAGRTHSVGQKAFYEFTLGLRTVASYGPGAFRETTRGQESIKERGVSLAIEHFRRALDLDSQFVEAKLWLIDQADIAGDHHALVDSMIASAQSQSAHVVPYDRLAIERQIAWVTGDNEGAYSRAKQMLSLEPHAPDAQLALLEAAIATRRYTEALSLVRTLRRQTTWLTPQQRVDSVPWFQRQPPPHDSAVVRRYLTFAPNLGGQLWLWEMELRHVRGEFDEALAVWREVAVAVPDDAPVCEMGIHQYAAKGSSAQVDSLVAACARLQNGAPLIPLRAYVDIALPEYLAHGHRDQAVRALSLVSARFEELKHTQRPKALFLGMYQAALGDWKTAYGNLSAGMDTSALDFRTDLAIAAAHLGDTTTVRATMRWIDAWASRHHARGRDDMSEAFIALASGDTTLALGRLRTAMWEGVSPLHMDWYHELALQPLRNDPRLIALMNERQ